MVEVRMTLFGKVELKDWFGEDLSNFLGLLGGDET